MIDGPTEEVMGLEPFADKWTAFGFDVLEVNGHDFSELAFALDKALAAKDRPVVIIANTIKGCGIDFIAGDYKWHYGNFDEETKARAKASLARYKEERLVAIDSAKGFVFGDLQALQGKEPHK